MNLGKALLWPRSVALIGASDDATKTTSRPLQFLRRSGFSGTIYPINGRTDTVLGERAWPSLETLPETPDHAFIMAPTAAVPEVLAACVAQGIPIATVLAGGFSEEGADGRAREQVLREILAAGATRLLGPNSIGVVNVKNGLSLTANAAFAEDELPKGGLFVASHSGSMIGAILSRGKARGIGFAGLVSLGAEVDLSLGEICEATLDDPDIHSYALFLESIRHGAAIRRFALAACKRGRQVIAYKLGRSSQAAELSQSHTGAIAGEDSIADAFLKDIGIARVDTLDGLIEGAALLRRFGAPRRLSRAPQVAVVSTTGGGAAMIVDQLGIRGVEVAAPSDATMGLLRKRGVMVAHGRIVDLTLAGTRPNIMTAALDTLLQAPEFDLVVAVAGSSARFQPHLLVPSITVAASAARPLAAFVAPDAPDALAQLTAAGVACFRTPEACADAIAAAFARRVPKEALSGGIVGEVRHLDEAQSYAVLAGLGLPVAGHAIVAAAATSSPIAYPVALKLLSGDVVHKTELGGVVLGVKDDIAFLAAIVQITRAVKAAAPTVQVERLLVQAMVTSLGEVLLSFTRDPDAGPVVMLAAGGTLAELHKDRSLRLAPVDFQEAWEMIAEVKSLKALAGYRGRQAGDLHSLAHAIVALSKAGFDILEAEINPLLIRAEGVVAVDAVLQVIETAAGADESSVNGSSWRPDGIVVVDAELT